MTTYKDLRAATALPFTWAILLARLVAWYVLMHVPIPYHPQLSTSNFRSFNSQSPSPDTDTDTDTDNDNDNDADRNDAVLSYVWSHQTFQVRGNC